MANWCRYCKGNYPNYWCEVTDNYIPWDIIERSCKNNGYKCSYYHISTAIGVILNKDLNDPVLDNIKTLRDNYMEKDEKYSSLLKMYDSIGPVISSCLEEDNKEKIEEYYDKVLLPISKLVQNKKYDISLDHYSYFTRILINQYGLNELYETLEETIQGYDISTCKKSSNMKKTLDL